MRWAWHTVVIGVITLGCGWVAWSEFIQMHQGVEAAPCEVLQLKRSPAVGVSPDLERQDHMAHRHSEVDTHRVIRRVSGQQEVQPFGQHDSSGSEVPQFKVAVRPANTMRVETPRRSIPDTASETARRESDVLPRPFGEHHRTLPQIVYGSDVDSESVPHPPTPISHKAQADRPTPRPVTPQDAQHAIVGDPTGIMSTDAFSSRGTAAPHMPSLQSSPQFRLATIQDSDSRRASEPSHNDSDFVTTDQGSRWAMTPAAPPISDTPVAVPDAAPSAQPTAELGWEPAPFGSPNRFENACFDPQAFSPDPSYAGHTYQPGLELDVYRGKFCVPAQAPWVELGRGLYRPGPLPPAATIPTGETNPIIPHFLVFGDLRTAVAHNDNGNGNEATIWASRLNLDFDFKITSTERIHAFWGPLDRGGQFTRAEFRDGNLDLIPELDGRFDTFFFEGDLGYMWGGITDRWAPFDLPFVAGKYPLLFQNGIWMVDAIEGFAFTIPSRNGPLLDWSNFDVTFFFAFDDVDSAAFASNAQANIYGATTFIEAYDGYWEVGYAYLEDRSAQGLSYHNLGVSFTRRFLHRVSSSFRAIINAGQDPDVAAQTADGQLLLWENAFITHAPNYFVPYVNAFVGFDRPQSVARAAGTGGILVNTGINFESDGLTNYPTLDATGSNTWGGACGINLLGPDFSWQLVTEIAMVQTFRSEGLRTAIGDQYAFGARFQLPLNNAWIWRVDGMYGIRQGEDDLRGARTELRWKF